MQRSYVQKLFSWLVSYTVLGYGLAIIAATLIHQLQVHEPHAIDTLFISLPLLIGLGYVYLANLLLRLKYNAWLTACSLSIGSIILTSFEIVRHVRPAPRGPMWLRLVVPLLVLVVLLASKRLYRVRSDMRSFTQAVRISVVILLVTFFYGVGGFCLLDDHDFHQEISLPTAAHQTVDQFGLTTTLVTPHSRRAVLFVDSLSASSIGALVYVGLAFFQPIRQNLTGQNRQRQLAEKLLKRYPSDGDDYFKLWPHDKHYFFDATATAGLAYHVSRGVALVAGDPFGNSRQFKRLIESFQELCFVNDWLPSFVHVSNQHAKLYASHGYTLQKIGETATLQLADWPATQIGKSGKYFREIRNRFVRQDYQVEIIDPPHGQATLKQLRVISDEWLHKPGRSERGFMLGYHDEGYLDQCTVAVLRKADGTLIGFMNLVPTYRDKTANYDLLRCLESAPGNSNDFLLMSVLDHLYNQRYQMFNFGLSPLAGINNDNLETNSLIDNALGFLYANGDRLYSFSGLYRYKNKYNPIWEPRYIAYRGGVANFTRTLAALNRTMKVK